MDLQFIEHMSVEDFKASNEASKLEVMRNPLTGKLFFSCGKTTGAVSTKGIPDKGKAQMCKVKNETGEFWLLCEKGNAEVLAEF